MEFGTKVKAYPLDGTGPKVGFFVKHEGNKDAVQVGADVHALAYREPANYDAEGPNGTYCKV